MILSKELVEVLAARLVEVKTANPDSYATLPADERRGWRASAERVLREELAPAIRKQRDEELRERLKSIIEYMRGGDCTFWACDGPDAPDVPMKTCSRCSAIKDLESIFEETDNA